MNGETAKGDGRYTNGDGNLHVGEFTSFNTLSRKSIDNGYFNKLYADIFPVVRKM